MAGFRACVLGDNHARQLLTPDRPDPDSMTPDLIFDIGMHQGEDTDFYLRKGFRVVAVDANPDLCDRNAHRFEREIQDGRLTIVNAAIAEKAGKVRFYLNYCRSDWGTLYESLVRRNERRGSPGHRPIEVESLRPETLFEKYGIPYYMKVDIEGADWICLQALGHVHELPRYISVENDKPVRQVRQLAKLGYYRFKIVSQRSVPEQREPTPPIEGRAANIHFQLGSSGLFGGDLPGTWMTKDEATRVASKVAISQKIVGLEGLVRQSWPALIRTPIERLFWRGFHWFDIHAAR